MVIEMHHDFFRAVFGGCFGASLLFCFGVFGVVAEWAGGLPEIAEDEAFEGSSRGSKWAKTFEKIKVFRVLPNCVLY